MKEWINKKVKVELKVGIYYKGLVVSAGDTYISLRDINSHLVFIKLENIDKIKEVSE